MLTASTSEAYAFLFKLLCDPGDAVLVPAPSYPLFELLAELEGVQALPYRLAYDGACGRCPLRTTSFRPDHTELTAQTLMSTQPSGRASARTPSSVMRAVGPTSLPGRQAEDARVHLE